MAPKRKSSVTALGRSSMYQLPGSASSKKRLITEESDHEGVPMTRSSTGLSASPSVGNLTSPSLENITTDLYNMRTPFAASSSSTMTTPITPETRHIVVPPPPPLPTFGPRRKTFLIIGASRGIGLEFTSQLLQLQHQVIAVVRNTTSASQLWQTTGSLFSRPGSCIIEQCDVSMPSEIDDFISRMKLFVERGGSIDTIILNAGILDYEKGLGALDVSFEMLEQHLRVNCVGNITLARRLLILNDLESINQRRAHELAAAMAEPATVIGRQVIFMSSDSGSMTDFREYEDGFAAYGASKVALNMMIRHMAAELKRRAQRKTNERKHDWQARDEVVERPWESEVCVLAIHPGEVSTDMANIELGWEVEGVITAQESVRDMLRVVENKDSRYSGTFWRWDGTTHPW